MISRMASPGTFADAELSRPVSVSGRFPKQSLEQLCDHFGNAPFGLASKLCHPRRLVSPETDHTRDIFSPADRSWIGPVSRARRANRNAPAIQHEVPASGRNRCGAGFT